MNQNNQTKDAQNKTQQEKIKSGLVGEIRPSEIRLPMLQIVQEKSELVSDFYPGAIVLDKQISLSSGERAVEMTILSARKYYQQKLPFGSDQQPEMYETAAQIAEAGGSLDWERGQSPTHEAILRLRLLIKMPEMGARRIFALPFEGSEYAEAIWVLRGLAYRKAGTTILTAASQLSRIGGAIHSIKWLLGTNELTLRNGTTVYAPVLKSAGRHKSEFLDFLGNLIN